MVARWPRKAMARCLLVLACLGAGGAGMGLGAGQTRASQMPRPVIALHCEDRGGILCQAMFQVLAEAAPGRAIRINPNPPVSDAVQVTLHTKRPPTGMTASLSWKVGAGPEAHGPACIARQSDALTSHAQARQYAIELVKITPELRTILS